MRIVGFIPAEIKSAGIFESPPEEIIHEAAHETENPEPPPEELKKPSRRGKKKSEDENADNSTGVP